LFFWVQISIGEVSQTCIECKFFPFREGANRGLDFRANELKSIFFIFVKMNLKYELQSIISGAGKNPKRSIIEAAAHDLGKSQEPSGNAQAIEFSKD